MGLSELARHIAPDHRPALEILLANSADPLRAVRALESFAAQHPDPLRRLCEKPFGLQALVALFSSSRFLTTELMQHPEWLAETLDAGSLHRGKDRAQFETELEHWLPPEGVPEPVTLAEFRRRRILRILLRDLLGFAALSETTEELSSLAEAILQVAYRRLRRPLEARFGVPQLPDGRPCGFSVIALGKLGGRELNYSSDIDLMFLYEGPGETAAASPISNKEFFKKLANQYTELLGTYTSEGLCYRVDLRLRPDGTLGEVCISREGAEAYYTARARDWELQMLIKARLAAGENEPGRGFLEWVQPMIYSTTIDFSAVESMSLTRERIAEKLSARRRSGAVDVKLCPGGIRDIEFLVQCLQRLHGGREIWIRHAGTLQSLVRLRDKDLLSDREYSRLAAAYQFLRHLEHRLQFDEDRQTHTIPEDRGELSAIARRMPRGPEGGDPAGASLLQTLQHHCEEVQAIYRRVVHAQQPIFHSPAPAPAAIPEPEPPGAPNLLRFLDSRAPRLAAALQRAKLGRTRTALEHFIEHALLQPDWIESLEANPALISDLLETFEHSPYLAEQLVRTPALFEELRGMRVTPLAPPVEPLATLIEEPSDIRQFFRRQSFRILCESICLRKPVFETLRRMSVLAEATIAACYPIAIRQTQAQIPTPRYTPARQMMVIALGRLGMGEFDLGSDADLVFVLPESDRPFLHFWTRAAERLVEILSSYTRDGMMFAVDTRLRPNGAAGALVQTSESFLRYFAESAEAWEGISYMKSRAVAGDVEQGTAFLKELQKVDWRRYGQGGRSKAELAQMRARLEREHGQENPLKSGPGGYYDIDFALLFLRLRGAGMFFKELNTPARVEVVEKMGHLDRTEAAFLLDAATFYRSLDHGLRLLSGHTEGSLPAAQGPRQQLAALVSRWTPDYLHDQDLELELRQIQNRTRAFFDDLFA